MCRVEGFGPRTPNPEPFQNTRSSQNDLGTILTPRPPYDFRYRGLGGLAFGGLGVWGFCGWGLGGLGVWRFGGLGDLLFQGSGFALASHSGGRTP